MQRESESEESVLWNEIGEVLDTEMSTVEDIRADLARNDKGNTCQTINNCMLVFQRDPVLKGAIRKNELSGKIDIVGNLGWQRTSSSLTDTDVYQIHWYLEKNYGLKNDRNINKAMNIVASENKYHPKIGKEQDSELHFNKGVAFDDIHDVVERNKDNLKDKGIIAIKGTKIFYDVYADMVSMSIKMIINENEYVIDEIVGALFEDFSCKFTIHEMQLDEKIQKVSLQTDIELIINIAGIEYREKGIIFKIDKSNKQYTLKLMSYPMYMLGHMVINNLVFQNIRNPFVIIKYMLESVDIDINGVAVPNEMKAERTFLVAMAINNLKLLNGSCSVGDVRIGEEIKVSSEFEELLEKGGADERVIIWTDQRATNHYEAYSLAKEKLMRVVDLVAFFAKNDCLAEYFGIGDMCEHWDASKLFPEISLMNIAYIEDCMDRQAICVSGNERIEPHVRELDDVDINNIESDWIEKCYIKCTQEKNKKIESLFNAIRWINKVGNSTNKGDNIIYCVMALEFCLYKEKGNTIVEDKLNEYGIKEQSLMKTLTQNISVKIKTEGLENADAQILEKLESDMNSYLASKLKEASFNSKLQRMVKRLDVPITEDEMKLIAFFRNKRNSMIHGKGMDEIKETSIKKMIGIVSRIITYKLQELLRGR